MKQAKVYPAIGERTRVVGCYSEVMMHFGLAGRPVHISLEYQTDWRDGVPYLLTDCAPMCQVWKDGQPFSGLITPGEGGFIRDEDGWYCYPDDGPGDADPRQVIEDLTEMLREATDVPGVRVITNLGL